MNSEKLSKLAANRFWIILLSLIISYLLFIYFGKVSLNSITESDFGRDLYLIYLTTKGYLPYVNYNWVYGPLTPFLYAITFKLFGISIINAVCQWLITLVVCIYVVYYLTKSFSNHLMAFLAALTFTAYYGFFIQTFNHLYGTLFILLALLFIKKYLDGSNHLFLFLTSFSCFLLSITKLNTGIAFSLTFFTVIFAYLIINKKPLKIPVIAFLSFVLLTTCCYGLLLLNTPADQIIKSFPYSSKYLTKASSNIVTMLFGFDISTFTAPISIHNHLLMVFKFFSLNLWYFIIIILAFILSYILYKKEKFSDEVCFVILLAVTSLACTHEFLLIGTYYSLRFWVLPGIVILLFFVIHLLLKYYLDNRFIKYAVIVIGSIFVFGLSTKLYIITLYKDMPMFYCPYPRAQVKFNNQQWLLLTVSSIKYIEENLSKDEKLLSIPQNLIYNFISERDYPSRFIEFAQLSNVTEKDEDIVIKDIEKEKVKLILIAHKRNFLTEYGYGIFGQTHCQKLFKYIQDNYDYQTTFMLNQNNPIVVPISFYKRKTPFKNHN